MCIMKELKQFFELNRGRWNEQNVVQKGKEYEYKEFYSVFNIVVTEPYLLLNRLLFAQW